MNNEVFCYIYSFRWIYFFSFISSDPINMTFKIPVIDKFSKNKLHKSRNGTRVKTKFVIKVFYQMLR